MDLSFEEMPIFMIRLVEDNGRPSMKGRPAGPRSGRPLGREQPFAH